MTEQYYKFLCSIEFTKWDIFLNVQDLKGINIDVDLDWCNFVNNVVGFCENHINKSYQNTIYQGSVTINNCR